MIILYPASVSGIIVVLKTIKDLDLADFALQEQPDRILGMV